MSLPNLLGISDDLVEKQNILIVNIDQVTTITTILDNKIQNVEVLEEGSTDFLNKINLRENSYAKAYEICKNTTIYTTAGRELQSSRADTTNIDDIMPTLYSVVSSVKKAISDSIEKIDKVYITGTGAMINNIDIYFQEYLEDTQCETLKPYFVNNIGDISMKDYQEVNTAISIALMGLGEGLKGMNFKVKTPGEGLPDWMKMDIGSGAITAGATNALANNDLGEEYSYPEMMMLRTVIAFILLFVIYSCFSGVLNHEIDKKYDETVALQQDITKQIAAVGEDNEKIQKRTAEYADLVHEIEAAEDKIEDRNQSRNEIPDLLNQLMYVIPEDTRMNKIDNTEDKHISIEAQATKYEQLGYFKAKIKSEGILTNVTSTGGDKNEGIITIKIEGDLP